MLKGTRALIKWFTSLLVPSTSLLVPSGITALEKAQGHHHEGDAFVHAKHMREHVIPEMAELRKAADKLESIVSDDLWPLPTYREMLFVR